MHSGELDNGEEVILFGDELGNVYRLDNGATGFNGDPIEAFLTLAYTDLGTPSYRKRFRRVWMDIRSGTSAEISVLPDFDFGSIEAARHPRDVSFMLGGGLWSAADWGEFAWSAPALGQTVIDIAGTGTSINFAVYSNSVSEPHELLGYDITYEYRRLRRG
jgi:hypothetical protein